MAQNNRSNYLESKIMTASPAQLHLMLIEGAIRFCMKAQQELEKNNEGYANEAMVRAIDIVGELLAGVRSQESEINSKLSELYLFLFHTLTSAYVNTDATKLTDVLRILDFERETWQLACQRVQEESSQDSPQPTKDQQPKTPITPHVNIAPPQGVDQGLSFEA